MCSVLLCMLLYFKVLFCGFDNYNTLVNTAPPVHGTVTTTFIQQIIFRVFNFITHQREYLEILITISDCRRKSFYCISLIKHICQHFFLQVKADMCKCLKSLIIIWSDNVCIHLYTLWQMEESFKTCQITICTWTFINSMLKEPCNVSWKQYAQFLNNKSFWTTDEKEFKIF